MRIRIRSLSSVLLVLAPIVVSAQQRPPIRALGAVTAKSAETFSNVNAVRALSNGGVLVNDVAGRRLLLFTPDLKTFKIVADSTSATGNAYAGRIAGLIPYRGDSTIFADPMSLSMLVIDASGGIARVMSMPRSQDATMIGGMLGGAAFDASGKLVYRAGGGMVMRGPMMAGAERAAAGGAGAFPIPEMPDSAPIVRIDLVTRKLDTLDFVKIPKIKFDVSRDDNGRMSMTSQINPLPVVDDWAVLPDGSVAFVRGRDYHVDWINVNGTKASSPKIPFDWRRMTDEDKIAFIDSVKAARERLGANAPVPLSGAGAAAGGSPGMQTQQIMIFGGPGGGGPGSGAPNNTVRGGGGQAQVNYVPASELPDYQPAFFAGATRADTDGNLWIRTIPTSALPGGPVYDVINRKGEIADRVQIPEGRSIIGFGAGGAVYLVNRQGSTATLERATVR